MIFYKALEDAVFYKPRSTYRIHGDELFTVRELKNLMNITFSPEVVHLQIRQYLEGDRMTEINLRRVNVYTNQTKILANGHRYLIKDLNQNMRREHNI